MTYKQLVNAIGDLDQANIVNKLLGEINYSFEHEKITWKDHETLYKIACMIQDSMYDMGWN